MNETLTALAVEYGWGCPTCEGTGGTWQEGQEPPTRCPDCHGNHVTPSDADRFMDEVARVVRIAEKARLLSILTMLRRPGQSLDSLQRKVT